MLRRTGTRAFARLVAMLSAGAAIAACNDVLSSPSVPASIEFVRLPAPAIVIGDSLRDISGAAVPVVAIVRNQQGDVLTDAEVRYTYADAARDSALQVDEVKGFVVSLRALSTSGTQGRIAARAGNNLQVIRTVLVTTRPDSVDRGAATKVDTLLVTVNDTGSLAASNLSTEQSVVVRHKEGTVVTQVPNWLVAFELVQPANPTNDTTKSVFLVNDLRAGSNIDTTNGSGIAARSVRVRGSQFPASAALDSVILRATVNYRGKPVSGSPVKIILYVIRKP